jgi:hypothetical protein
MDNEGISESKKEGSESVLRQGWGDKFRICYLRKLDIGHVELRKLDFGHVELRKLDIGHVELKKLDIGHVELRKLDIGHVELRKLDIGHVEPNQIPYKCRDLRYEQR